MLRRLPPRLPLLLLLLGALGRDLELELQRLLGQPQALHPLALALQLAPAHGLSRAPV